MCTGSSAVVLTVLLLHFRPYPFTTSSYLGEYVNVSLFLYFALCVMCAHWCTVTWRGHVIFHILVSCFCFINPVLALPFLGFCNRFLRKWPYSKAWRWEGCIDIMKSWSIGHACKAHACSWVFHFLCTCDRNFTSSSCVTTAASVLTLLSRWRYFYVSHLYLILLYCVQLTAVTIIMFIITFILYSSSSNNSNYNVIVIIIILCSVT